MSCRFIHCNKCTALAEDVIIGENSACVGVRMYWKSLYFSLTFAMNLKLPKKKKNLNAKKNKELIKSMNEYFGMYHIIHIVV